MYKDDWNKVNCRAILSTQCTRWQPDKMFRCASMWAVALKMSASSTSCASQLKIPISKILRMVEVPLDLWPTNPFLSQGLSFLVMSSYV